MQLAKCWKHRESGTTTLRGGDNVSGAVNQQERPASIQRLVDPRESVGVVVDFCWRRNPQRPYASQLISTDELKIWSEPYGDIGSNSSEIPCRVSSDLHEWRNDFPTVSTTDSAKLKYE